MIIPGVQKPHCSPWHSRNASCTGCSCPSFASPSIVVTSAPSASTASTLQDFTLVPSRWTVQAPQLLVSHPMTVPVFPRRSRRYCTSSIRGSTSSETDAPSTVRLIRVMDDSLRCEAVTRLTLEAWLAKGWRVWTGGGSAAGDREPALEQGYGGVGAALQRGEADLDDLGVVRRPLAVADHGIGLRVGQQRLPDRDRDVLGQLSQRGRVGAGQQVLAVRLDRLHPAAAEQGETWSTSVVAGIISR